MPKGGARRGAGRPKGSAQRITTMAREQAAVTGLLPHEWLLRVARGEPIMHTYEKVVTSAQAKKTGKTTEVVTEAVYASFDMRLDAAKAAAPYYAPKLSAQTVSLPDPIHASLSSAPIPPDVLREELRKRGLPETLLKD